VLVRLLEFTEALRRAGVPVSVSEDIDALKALAHIRIDRRAAFKATLAATMLKSESHRPAFESLFNVYFDGAGPPELDLMRDSQEPPQSAGSFLEEMFEAISSGDGGGSAIRDMARRAVTLFGRVPDSPSNSLYFEYPVFRALDMDALRRRLAESGAPWSELDPYEARLLRDRFDEAVRAFRAAVKLEVQQRVARRKGPESVAKNSIRPLPEDLDLATASRAELDALRKAVRPLARKLAARTAMKRRRAARGGVDMRRTMRHSLSSGGVPFDVALRHRPLHKPELFVLCDISSSVARFARFSLMLVHALASQFSKVRSFVFIDTIDEVTHLFEREDFLVAVDKVNEQAKVVWIDGHSNYGAVLERFAERYGADVSARSTILVLGDARNNFRVPRAEVLKELHGAAKHVYWLNPEPEPYWDTGDSAASAYAAFTDGMFEVRTLRHLEDFVERVLV
jgi:uncharacterized protein with von Willebrand factor type A (vWA) domain